MTTRDTSAPESAPSLRDLHLRPLVATVPRAVTTVVLVATAFGTLVYAARTPGSSDWSSAPMMALVAWILALQYIEYRRHGLSWPGGTPLRTGGEEGAS